MAMSSTYYVNRVQHPVPAGSGYYMGMRLGYRVLLVELSHNAPQIRSVLRSFSERDQFGGSYLGVRAYFKKSLQLQRNEKFLTSSCKNVLSSFLTNFFDRKFLR